MPASESRERRLSMFDNELIKELALICVNAQVVPPAHLNAVSVYENFKQAYEQIEAAYEKDKREKP